MKSYLNCIRLIVLLGACTVVPFAADGKALYRAN